MTQRQAYELLLEVRTDYAAMARDNDRLRGKKEHPTTALMPPLPLIQRMDEALLELAEASHLPLAQLPKWLNEKRKVKNETTQ